MADRRFDPSRSEFIISLPKWRNAPGLDKPMVVAAGRSNVGKSSFINMILRRKGLARTSSTPGRTQLLNFFNIDDTLIIADVPGYGFAKAPREVVRKWTENVRDFVVDAESLCAVIQLLDIRRKPTMDDLFFLDLVAKTGLPLIHVVTKTDKVKRGQRAAQLRAIASEIEVKPSALVVTSAKDGEGRDETWKRIFEHI